MMKRSLCTTVCVVWLRNLADFPCDYRCVQVWDYDHSVETRSAAGGTSRGAVLAQIKQLNAWLDSVALE